MNEKAPLSSSLHAAHSELVVSNSQKIPGNLLNARCFYQKLQLQDGDSDTDRLRSAPRQCASSATKPALKFPAITELLLLSMYSHSRGTGVRQLTLMVFVDWHFT
ncbi:hypothetical protein AMECASPLE_021321 [Ameca splendens]|uniref:Uncharacterized protein n=1 Tax=Ameca splendens TaxID=208324 RepID=A0ABV1A1J6_9TELE